MSQWGAIYPAVQNFKNTEQYLIKECIKNCLIVMPFNKILIITNVNIVLFPHFWSTIWGGGSSQQGNCISKKIQETTIYPGKLMKTIPYRES